MDALRFVVAALTKNWGLKLLALALAVVIYHSLKPAENRRAVFSHDRPLFQNP